MNKEQFTREIITELGVEVIEKIIHNSTIFNKSISTACKGCSTSKDVLFNLFSSANTREEFNLWSSIFINLTKKMAAAS
jgi:hypothetical protein